MSNLKANLKDGLGTALEETGEALGSRKMAHAGRKERNEGRIEKGELPKLHEPGTEKHKE